MKLGFLCLDLVLCTVFGTKRRGTSLSRYLQKDLEQDMMWWNLAFCVLILCFVPFLGQNVEARAYLGIFRRTWNYDSCFDMLSFVPGLLQGSPLRSARKYLQTSLFKFKVCLENQRFEFPDMLLEIFCSPGCGLATATSKWQGWKLDLVLWYRFWDKT